MIRFTMAEEAAYVDLVKRIITEGKDVIGRNGPVRTLIGAHLRFSSLADLFPY